MDKPIKTHKKQQSINKRRNREFMLTVSMFLLSRESLKKQFWSVKSVKYDGTQQKVSVGVNTTNGKLGTTLAKLRQTSHDLSDYLYDQGLTFRKAKIVFFVDKEDIEIERIYNLLHTIEQHS
jgi:hypothetical protein